MKKGRVVEAEVTGFSKRGNGLASDDAGRKIEVPYALVGEKVAVALHGKRKGVFRGQLQSVLQPVEHRIEPKCGHFGSCGGCRWQQLSYSEQLHYKQQLIDRCFGNLLNGVEQHPIIACDPPWRYRNKMEFTFSETRSGQRYLGLIKEGLHRDVFNLEECHLCSPWMVEATTAVRKWWESSGLAAYHGRANSGSLRTLTVREGVRTGDRMVILTVSGNADYALSKEQIQGFKESVCAAVNPEEPGLLSVFLRIQQSLPGVPTSFFDMHLHGPQQLREELHVPLPEGKQRLQFSISPAAFFQPNTFQAEKLYGLALQMAEVEEGDHVFDLYCGTGTLGICAALKAGRVTGVELSPDSCVDARANTELNGCRHVEILCSSVGTELVRLQKEQLQPDVVMVDPPRAGLETKAIEQLAAFQAPRLVYVSCNPITQATNIAELLGAGYCLKSMQAVDQFPHTAHIENVALLVKEK